MIKPADATRPVAATTLTMLTDFFGQPDHRIIAQVFDRARRARATKIRVATKVAPNGDLLAAIYDDGIGVTDLHSFIENVWKDGRPLFLAQQYESPAQHDFGIHVRSRHQDHTSGWHAQLQPNELDKLSLRGVHEDAIGCGTEVSFCAGDPNEFEVAVVRCSRYLPLDVSLNGEPLRRENFLHDVVKTKKFRNATIAVCKAGAGGRSDNVCYYGQTTRVELPRLPSASLLSADTDISSVNLVVKIVIEDGNSPADADFRRNWVGGKIDPEVVRVFQDQARTALFDAVSDLSEHKLPYFDYRNGVSLGFSLPEAEEFWCSQSPEIDGVIDPRAIEQQGLNPDNLLILPDALQGIELKNLLRAFRHSRSAFILATTPLGYEGYSWCGNRQKVTNIEWFVRSSYGASPVRTGLPVEAMPLPEEVYALVTITCPDGSERHIEAATDMTFNGGRLQGIDGPIPLVSGNGGLGPNDFVYELTRHFVSLVPFATDSQMQASLQDAVLHANRIARRLFRDPSLWVDPTLQAFVGPDRRNRNTDALSARSLQLPTKGRLGGRIRRVSRLLSRLRSRMSNRWRRPR